MSENTTTTTTTGTKSANGRVKGLPHDPIPESLVKLFALQEEAKTAYEGASWRTKDQYELYHMYKGEKELGWLWARGYENAIATVARLEGVTASKAGQRSRVVVAPVTEDAAMTFVRSQTLEWRQKNGIVLPSDPPLPTPEKPSKGGKGSK